MSETIGSQNLFFIRNLHTLACLKFNYIRTIFLFKNHKTLFKIKNLIIAQLFDIICYLFYYNINLNNQMSSLKLYL